MKRTLRLSLLVLVAAASLTIIAASSWSLVTRSARGRQRASPGGETSHRTNAPESRSLAGSLGRATSMRASDSGDPDAPEVVDRSEALPSFVPEREPEPIVPHPISVTVEDGITIDGEPYMQSLRRASRGVAVHAKRESLSNGSVRIIIDNANLFSGDIVQIDLSRAPDGLTKAEAVVLWTADFGPPFDGAYEILSGQVILSSNDWQQTSPLTVDFDLQCQGSDEPRHEKGRVAVP